LAVGTERPVWNDAAEPVGEERHDLAPERPVGEQPVDEDQGWALSGLVVADGTRRCADLQRRHPPDTHRPGHVAPPQGSVLGIQTASMYPCAVRTSKRYERCRQAEVVSDLSAWWSWTDFMMAAPAAPMNCGRLDAAQSRDATVWVTEPWNRGMTSLANSS